MTTSKLRPTEIPEAEKLRQGIFTPAVVESIVKAANNGEIEPDAQVHLSDYLNEVIREYFSDRWDEEAASAGQVANMASDISKACAKTLEAAGLGNDADLADLYPALRGGGLFAFSALDGGGAADVERAFAAVAKLKRWSDALCFSATMTAKRTSRPNKGSRAYSKLLSALGEAYLHYWNDLPGRGVISSKPQKDVAGNKADSVSSDKVDSPFIRFLLHVHNHVAVSVKSFRRKQPAALAAAWRRNETAMEITALRKMRDDMAKLRK